MQFLRMGGQIVQFVCIMHVMQTYAFDVTMCVGPSMLPTINSAGDIVLIDRMTHRLRDVVVGDVVLAKAPSDPSQTVCKRVRGVAGDHVCYSRPRTGSVEFSWNRKGITVPNGHVWLQGDNEANSTDSRHYGPVPEALVRGIVRCRIWPPPAVGALGEFSWQEKTVEWLEKEEEEARLHRERMAEKRRVRRAKADAKRRRNAERRRSSRKARKKEDQEENKSAKKKMPEGEIGEVLRAAVVEDDDEHLVGSAYRSDIPRDEVAAPGGIGPAPGAEDAEVSASPR